MKAKLKEDISNVRAEVAGLRADLAAFEARFIQRPWLVSAIIVGLNVTLIKRLA